MTSIKGLRFASLVTRLRSLHSLHYYRINEETPEGKGSDHLGISLAIRPKLPNTRDNISKRSINVFSDYGPSTQM